MKVMVVVGTRPELIRLALVVKRLRETMDCVLVHTGQNFSYELGEIFYGDLEMDPPDYYLGVVGASLAETLGNIIIKVDAVLESERPDALLVLGDTNSALSVIPAKRRKIPIFHYEAGNRCFDQRVPEEINRKIVDHTADINLTYSEIAKQNLLREGFSMDRVFNIGSPMFEVLRNYSGKIAASTALARHSLEPGRYFLLSSHREENVDDQARLEQLLVAMRQVRREYGFPILFSVHPRTEARLRQFGFGDEDGMVKSPPFCFTDYVALQKAAYCVLSDSGTITEESSILGFPAINLRETHERLEGMEKAVVPMTGFSAERIREAIRIVAGEGARGPANAVPDYQEDHTAEKVVRIVLSYTDYVNRKIWMKGC